MAKNVMKLLKPSPNLGKNGFDLSHRKVFDARMGELLPCCCIETVPDDDITINTADLLRAMPMITSPFMRVKQHIDFWFVPYNNLWHQFNAFITSRDEPASSVLKNSQYLPHVNLQTLKQYIHASTCPSVHNSNSQFKDGAYKILDLLGYPTYNYALGDPAEPVDVYDDVDVNLFRLAAYQNIWYHEYRQKYYDDGNLGLQSGASQAALASMFNFDFCRCDTYAHANIIAESENTFGFSTYYDNITSLLCQPRYRTWKKDLFTGLMPSTQLGAVATVGSGGTQSIQIAGFTNDDTNRWASGGDTWPGGSTVTAEPGANHNLFATSVSKSLKHDHYFEKSFNITTGSFDILALRSAQALQIWRENALRAGNQIEDNYEAHYGTKPHTHMFEHPIALGSIDAPLNISDVMATADTGTGASNDCVGDIAGKGISSFDGNKTIRFKTNDFGVIMGIFSLLPESEYNSTGVDRPNQLIDRFDFFMPEMENLGLEAVDSRTFSVEPQNHFVVGYAPRYFGYKTILDKVHNSFLNCGPSSWLGPYRAWTSARYDVFGNFQYLPKSSLYVNPAVFNENFVSGADQFLVDMFNSVKAVRPMSVTGMPSK